MTARPMTWGVLAWPLTGAVACVLPPGDWDMPVGSVIGIVAATALAFALVGAALWLPAAHLLESRARNIPVAGRALVFALLGFVLGSVVAGALSLVTRTSISPSSVGAIAELAFAASAASILGWLGLRVMEGRRSRRSTLRRVGAADAR